MGNCRVSKDLASGDALVSLGKLAKKGFTFVLDDENPYVLHKATGEKADMKLIRNSFYMPATVASSMEEAKKKATASTVAVATAAEGQAVDTGGSSSSTAPAPAPGAQKRKEPEPSEKQQPQLSEFGPSLLLGL